MLAAVVLYIVALSTNWIWSGRSGNLGFNHGCAPGTNEAGLGPMCSDVGFTDCSLDNGFGQGVTFLNSGKDCNTFEASKVLLIIAICSSGVGMILMAAHAARQFFAYHHTVGTFFAKLGFICAIIAWGLMIHVKHALNDDLTVGPDGSVRNGWNYDYGFWLTMVGWICNLIGTWYYYGTARYYYTKEAGGYPTTTTTTTTTY